MMAQDEEDLEEELQYLDIQEDLGAEDSDATPVNTPPCTPPVLYIKKYPPQPVEERYKEPERPSRLDDFDNRSESSLSWGDDEFEGEATRQVEALFDQIDTLLYKEDNTLTPVPYTSQPNDGSSTSILLENLDSDVNVEEHVQELSSRNPFEGLSRLTIESQGALNAGVQLLGVSDTNASEVFYDSGKLLPFKSATTHQPSPELQEECLDWVHHFPHFRVKGNHISSGMMKLLDRYLDAETPKDSTEEDNNEVEEEEEETIAQDGNFYDLLPLVTCNRTNKPKEKVNPKREASGSRVCSGSNDPEVLKEQVLIMLFDKLWSSMTGVIEPLLHQYAKYVIEQSVQYSSLSRESSTRGSRVGDRVFSSKMRDDLDRTKPKFPLPSNALNRPTSGAVGRSLSAKRPLSSICRPVSAVNRLQSAASVSGVHQEELQDLLQVSPKLLQNHEDKIRSRSSSTSTTRGSSAQSYKSQLSLPSLPTPRTPVHRPVSSKASNHLLTPIKVEALTSAPEQRPASTSSYHSRARFQEKLQHLSRHRTIQESWGDNQEVEAEEPSSMWSRHISFLPPISDSTEATLLKQPQSLVMTGGNPPLATLSVRGKPLLAAPRPHSHSRAKRHVLGPPIIESRRSQKLIHPSFKF